ncbi:MAG: sulfate adenylyltransferase [Verrucomicrobia bacterium]|nr:sulfate adenylyltransferase [Verrucomicrobiota bacterium]
MIEPHGGKLVNCLLEGNEAAAAAKKAAGLPRVAVSSGVLVDMENIARGAYSPIEGFMGERDTTSVLAKGRLADNTPWTIPIVLDVDTATAKGLKGDVAVTDEAGDVCAILTVKEQFGYDKAAFAQAVYGTTDEKHPGVARTMAMKDTLVAGPIRMLKLLPTEFGTYKLSPKETRVLFEKKGWETVCAFQTRNVPHRGHEDLQKTVLRLVDGLMIQPVIGKKKAGDFKDHLIVGAYEKLIDVYFNSEHVVLTILPLEMRYAGPKEAVMHAIMRKNYGCTHIIIGRDHAGVGKYYHPEAAINIFRDYPDIGIEPISIRGDFFFDTKSGQIESDRTIATPDEAHIPFSGTKIRNMIVAHTPPPAEIMRPEVFQVIDADPAPFVE